MFRGISFKTHITTKGVGRLTIVPDIKFASSSILILLQQSAWLYDHD